MQCAVGQLIVGVVIRVCNESCGTAVGMLRTSYLCTGTEYEQPVQSHKHQQYVFTLYLPPTHVRTQDDQALPLTSDIFVGPNWLRALILLFWWISVVGFCS